ncbi:MAG: alpha/beta fold hydrolase [Acidobacteriota bacterium]
MVRLFGVVAVALGATVALTGPSATTPTADRVTSGMVKVKGGELYYEMKGTGRPVVLLHAGLLDRRMWDGQFDTFARHYRVIRYDARGHGMSSMPRGELCNYEDLHDLLVGLHVSHAALVGVSLGGRTAIDFTLKYPKMVDALVLANPGISGWQFTDPVLASYQKNLQAAAERGDLDGYVEYFQRAWTDGPRRKPSDVDPHLRAAVRAMARENLTRLAASGNVKVVEVGALSRLGEIHAPTLVIAGALDSSDILNIVGLLGAQVPGARKVMIPAAGHVVNMEQPAEFNRIVLEFLAGLDAQPAPAR